MRNWRSWPSKHHRRARKLWREATAEKTLPSPDPSTDVTLGRVNAGPRGIDHAVDLIAGRRVLALTGAGLSTDSGIPDYRGPGSPPRTPMTYAEFVSGEAAQRRYWARALVGWRQLSYADPNPGHHALAALERGGVVTGLITQNVDGLHSRAGQHQLIDLHGRVANVVCLTCRHSSSRREVHRRLSDLNPHVADRTGTIAPDGDAVLDDVDGFQLVRCACGGALKPDVVFFGENVPRDRVAHAMGWLDQAEVLLVAGSSLHVMSGFRFVRRAAEAGIPVIIINRGPTRGDALATRKLEMGCAQALTDLAYAVRAPDSAVHHQPA
ncbi:MAG: NAD-dependent protein deacetylase [Nocardioidaceae bacterium]|nr:NAD-dependent protein deacetylase [Nocardioidaceae bacterium]